MQTPDDNCELRLTFFCKDPGSKDDDDCASFYRTNRRTWFVQGDRREEPAYLAQLMTLKAGETAVEIPDALVELFVQMYLKERGDEADHRWRAEEAD